MKITAKEHCCEEASTLSRETYIPCNAPADVVVYSEKDGREYRMCIPCANHNVRNRGMRKLRNYLRTTHRFNQGDRVAIFNSKMSGEPIYEGSATVVRRLEADNQYMVRFEDGTVVERFAMAKPGNEADDCLEELRAKWRAKQAVA